MPGLSAVSESFSPELEERVRLQQVSSLTANPPGTEAWVTSSSSSFLAPFRIVLLHIVDTSREWFSLSRDKTSSLPPGMAKGGCLAAVYCRKICSSASHTDFSVSCFKLTYIYSCFSVLPVSLIPGSGLLIVCSCLESLPLLTPHLVSGS